MNENNVVYLNASDLEEFPNHPYNIEANEDLDELIGSIEDHGITSPVLVWETDDGRYIVLSGHRRTFASQLLSYEDERFAKIPCIVRRGLTLDEATIIMVDENARRTKLKPSEKAWAYRMKLEAMKRTAGRPRKDENSVTMWQNFEPAKTTREIIAESSGISASQIQMYIRLTYLCKHLLRMVDDEELGFRAAVELSYLNEEDQESVYAKIRELDKYPTLKQAKLIKQASQSGELNAEELHRIFTEITLDERVTFRMRPDQREQLESMSVDTQMSKSEILRALSNNGKAVYVGRETVAELLDIRADVARVGNLMKMRHNTLSLVAENPFLAEQDQELIKQIYNENIELHDELARIRRQLIDVCKRINGTVKELNKND